MVPAKMPYVTILVNFIRVLIYEKTYLVPPHVNLSR